MPQDSQLKSNDQSDIITQPKAVIGGVLQDRSIDVSQLHKPEAFTTVVRQPPGHKVLPPGKQIRGVELMAGNYDTHEGNADVSKISIPVENGPLRNEALLKLSYTCISKKKYNSGSGGLNIVINNTWNLERLEQLLSEIDYKDIAILTYIKYGWPANRSLDADDPVSSSLNHKGATEFPQAINKYLHKEISKSRMMGPFTNPPFQGLTDRIGISPLNSVPKRESDQRRIIIDFSWPKQGSVNEAIDKNTYMGIDVNLKYPTVDDLAERIFTLGTGCAIFKRDLTSAFRQLFGDPFDYSLMIYQWNELYYVDVAVAMGMVSAPYCCQRTTDALAAIHVHKGYWLMNYIDDFIGAEKWSKVFSSFHELGQLFREVGISESHEKKCPPDTEINCLGTLFNSLNMTMQVTPDRLLELHNLLEEWHFKELASRKQVEKLIGKIQFVTNCVKQGRVFICKLLNYLRGLPKSGYFPIPLDTRKDIKWWYTFLPKFNGVSVLWHLRKEALNEVLATDASLRGGGGIAFGKYFRIRWPKWVEIKSLGIAHLEMLALIVGLKLWSHKFSGNKFSIACDNQACVELINKGRAVDEFLQDCLREVAYLASIHDFWIRAVYIDTKRNIGPDKLSRWHISRNCRKEAKEWIKSHQLQRTFAHLELLQFSHTW